MNKALLVLLTLALMALMVIATSPHKRPTTAQIPTATGTSSGEYAPIEDEDEAIELSLSLFPPIGDPANPIARLVSLATYEDWVTLTGLSAPLQTQAASETQEWGNENPDSPVWFVAIQGTGLTVRDVIQPPGGIELADDRVVDGAYYVWEANTGMLLAVGALVTGGDQSYTSIAVLPTESLTITQATPFPTPGTPSTAKPTATLSAAALATLVPQYTAQALSSLTAAPTYTGTSSPTSTLAATPTATESPSPTPTPATFAPSADAYTLSTNPTQNYGTASVLNIRGSSSPYYRSYLKFDVSGLSGTAMSAILRLWVSDTSVDYGQVGSVSSSWTETGLTWNNQPSMPMTFLTVLGPENGYVTIDVSTEVGRNGTYSFGIESLSSDLAAFGSREDSNTDHRPLLTIVTQ
jgi:hypothetical protein